MKAEMEKAPFSLKGLLKNKYALVVLVVGLVLVLLPTGDKSGAQTQQTDITPPEFSLSREEERLESQLSRISGAGRVSVLLSVEGSAFRQLAQGQEQTLVISAGSGEKVVELQYINPRYTGAVIVCDGAHSPQVRLDMTQAVCAYTSLTTEKVQIIAME